MCCHLSPPIQMFHIRFHGLQKIDWKPHTNWSMRLINWEFQKKWSAELVPIFILVVLCSSPARSVPAFLSRLGVWGLLHLLLRFLRVWVSVRQTVFLSLLITCGFGTPGGILISLVFPFFFASVVSLPWPVVSSSLENTSISSIFLATTVIYSSVSHTVMKMFTPSFLFPFHLHSYNLLFPLCLHLTDILH